MARKNLCGQRIQKERMKQGFRQIDLVVALQEDFNIKLDSTSLGRIERNERGVWDTELLAISKILNISVQWLLTGESEWNSTPVD